MLFHNSRRSQIAKILPKQSVGAEIGVMCGHFSKALGKAILPRQFFLIDPWWTLHGDSFSFRPHLSTRKAYEETLRRMQWWTERRIVTLLVQRSQEALAAMKDGQLDWAYLDSSHDYAETLQELDLLRRKVKPDGIICGHDFNSRKHPGVFRAVADFLRASTDYKLCYLDNFTQWAVRRVT